MQPLGGLTVLLSNGSKAISKPIAARLLSTGSIYITGKGNGKS